MCRYTNRVRGRRGSAAGPLPWGLFKGQFGCNATTLRQPSTPRTYCRLYLCCLATPQASATLVYLGIAWISLGYGNRAATYGPLDIIPRLYSDPRTSSRIDLLTPTSVSTDWYSQEGCCCRALVVIAWGAYNTLIVRKAGEQAKDACLLSPKDIPLYLLLLWSCKILTDSNGISMQ